MSRLSDDYTPSFGSGAYVASSVVSGGLTFTTVATDTPGFGLNLTRSDVGKSMGFYYYSGGTRYWQSGMDNATSDYVIIEDSAAGKDLIRIASSTRVGYDGCNIVIDNGATTPSANARLQIVAETADAFLAETLLLTQQRTNAGASSVFAGAAGVPSGAALLVTDNTTPRAVITPRGWAAFGHAYNGRSNVGGVEVSRTLTIDTTAPPAWAANTLYVVGEVYQNAGTYYIVQTQYVSGATFGTTDTTNTSTTINPVPKLSLIDFASGTHSWSIYNDIANSYEFVVSNGTRIIRINGSAAVQNLIFVGSDSSLHLATSTTKLGFFSTTLGALQQTITGALSSVTDANAKAVLTSILTAFTNYNFAVNGTT